MGTDSYLQEFFMVGMIKINPKVNRLLKIIAKECSRLKIKAYLVGGPVRDLLLGKSNIDLDIAVDRDVEKLAHTLAKLFHGRSVYHRQFKTATLFLDKLNIDIATTREELYSSSGALPRIHDASLEKDLFRRDFTINAIAIQIKDSGLGSIIDPYNGMSDLKNRKIRILHERSFLDDPTRIIRAIRFETRLNFSLERKTHSLLKDAVSQRMLYKVTPSRIGNEMIKLLQENHPIKGVKRLSQFSGLTFMHPKIKFDKTWRLLFSDISRYVFIFNKFSHNKIKPWIIYFMVLTDDLKRGELNNLCQGYGLRRHERELILRAHYLKKNINKPDLFKWDTPSIIYGKLKPICPEAIIYLITQLKKRVTKNKLLNFLIKVDRTRLEIKGEDLKKMGFIPGPIFNKILEKVYLAKLDSKVSCHREELKFIRDSFGRNL